MLKNKLFLFFSMSYLMIMQNQFFAQCGSAISIGSASNAFTNGVPETNAIAVDNDLNTVLFVHRNNASTFGGNSGQLRYDISTNGGTTWTSNLGVLNPINTFQARFPNVSFYNPTMNTNFQDAYLNYLAPTINSGVFNSIVYGTRKLDGTTNTETYFVEDPSQDYVPKSMVQSSPGIYWAVDRIIPGGSNPDGVAIFKGVWNSSTNSVDWTLNQNIALDYNLFYDGTAKFASPNIGFDPSGQIGWISMLTHLNGPSLPYSFYPVFYKTTDGGATWTGPITIDIDNYNCFDPMIVPGSFLSTNFTSDLVVDVDGHPHLLTTLCNGNNAYAVFYVQNHSMVDITYNGSGWDIFELAPVKAGRATFGTNPNTQAMDMYEMAARSDDGSKVFFAWVDNSAYTLGQANTTPNLFSKSYDVLTKKWTTTKDFTSCLPALDGTMFFPKMGANVIESVASQYKLAVVRTTMTSNDPLLAANFSFIDNLVWNESDFSSINNTSFTSTAAGSWGDNVIWGNVCASPGLRVPAGVTVNVNHDVTLTGELKIFGTLNVEPGVIVTIDGNFVNEGLLKNNGTIITSAMNQNNGTYKGRGKIDGDFANNGRITPGDN